MQFHDIIMHSEQFSEQKLENTTLDTTENP